VVVGEDVDIGEGPVPGGLPDVEFLFGEEEIPVETQVGDGQGEGGISGHR
jgi:hypothetical protein